MDLELSDAQMMLKQSIADFMRREAPPDKISRSVQHADAFDSDLYQRAAEQGWLGMLLPEIYGGGGVSMMDCAVAFEEFGRGPLPAPVFTSGVATPQVILQAGSEEQKQRLLPAICSGELLAALAIVDSGAGWRPELVETQLTPNGGGYTVNGVKRFVQDGGPARLFIAAARTPGSSNITLVAIERDLQGVSVRPHGDLLAGVAEVQFDSVQVPASAVLGAVDDGWEPLEAAMQRALPILCAFQVGACQQIFEFTVEYTKVRIAFGQPIGRFQRVQDHMVELADQMDSARWITYETLWKLDSGQPAEAAVHEAKAVASEAYYWVCNYAHMVWAGPGTALEHPLMSHHIASRTLYQYLGEPAYHKRRMMDLLYPVAAGA
jgi:alkylation response protein AidB-like acyl-CoA dehydrogenase